MFPLGLQMQFLHAFFIFQMFSGASHAIGEKGEKGGRGESSLKAGLVLRDVWFVRVGHVTGAIGPHAHTLVSS